jgi:hypothetical protein
MKTLAIAALTLLFVGGASAQAKPVKAAAVKTNLTPEFAKAAFLYVEAVKNQAPKTKRDELLAEMKFATDEHAGSTKDFAASGFIENLFTLEMDPTIELAELGVKSYADKVLSCVSDVEQQLKSRTWVGAPKSCSQ